METEYPDFKELKIKNIAHLIFYVIIIIFNFALINHIIWIQKLLYYLFLSGSYFNFLFLIIPIISLFFLFYKKFTKKRIIVVRHFSLLFCMLALILGLYFAIILLIITIESSTFCKDCPFNIPISEILNNSNRCMESICELNNIDLDEVYPYEYICNYEPTKYFNENEGPFKRIGNNSQEIISDNQIICQKYENNYTLENEIIYEYLDLCQTVTEFYICQRFFEPKSYNLHKNFKCPNDNYFKYIYIFCILNVVFNLILSFIPWRIEINIYEKIIETFRENRASNSLNSTKFGSKIICEEEKFKKSPTELIIVCNDINIINNNEENKNKINTRNKKINNMTERTNGESNNNIELMNPQNSADIFILNSNKIKKSKVKK